MIKSVIIDDEPLARLNLSQAVGSLANWQVLDECENAALGYQAVTSYQPDVVFLDIQMPGTNGVDLARELLQLDRPPLLVFVTAHSEHAVEAFELFAFDYLLKPFDDERLATTLRRVEACLAPAVANMVRQAQHDDLHSGAAYLQVLIIRGQGSVRFVRVEEIYWLRASGNYVEVGHQEGVDLQRTSLTALQRKLDPALFFRIHRSAMIRLSELREYRQRSEDSGIAVLKDGSEHPVSASFKEALLQQMGAHPS